MSPAVSVRSDFSQKSGEAWNVLTVGQVVLEETMGTRLTEDPVLLSRNEDGHGVVSSSPSFAHNSVVIEVAAVADNQGEDLKPGTAVDGRCACAADTIVGGETVEPGREVTEADGGVKENGLSSPSEANTSEVIDAPV
jgi:hypothetical protein